MIIPRRRLLVGAGAALITRPALVRANNILGGSGGAPPASITLVQHTSGQGGVGVAAWPQILAGTVSGNLITACFSWYLTGSTTLTVTTNNGTTMAQATAAFHFDGTQYVAIWYGLNAANGSITVTGNFTGAGASFPTLSLQEWTGNVGSGNDEGIGNNGASTASSSVSILTNGTTTLANSLILSAVVPSTANPTSVGGSQTALENSLSSYQLVDSLGATITHTYGFAAANNTCQAIAAFK